MERLTATHQRTNTRHNVNHRPRRWRLLLLSLFLLLLAPLLSVLFPSLLPSLLRSLAVGLAVALASVRAISPTGGGSLFCSRSVPTGGVLVPCIHLNVSNRWRLLLPPLLPSVQCLPTVADTRLHSLECLPTVADSLPPCFLSTLFFTFA